jgi:hypothetical protein
MKLSEYIISLEKLKREHGDIEVERYSISFDRITAPEPEIAYREILTGRQRKSGFYTHGDISRKGEKVVKI